MDKFQTIPTKELQELVDRLLKNQRRHTRSITRPQKNTISSWIDIMTVEISSKSSRSAKAMTAKRMNSGIYVVDKHRSDPDTTQEEKDAIEDIRIIRRIKLRDADQARAVARATWEAYLDAAELADYFPNYNINSKAW